MSMRNISGNYYLVRNLSRDNEGTLATTEEEDGSMVRDRFKGFSLRVEVRRPAFITASPLFPCTLASSNFRAGTM